MEPVCLLCGCPAEVKNKHLRKLFGEWPDNKPGNMNFHFITERLVVGSMAWDPMHVKKLLVNGITHVINCTTHDVKEIYKNSPIQYLLLPTNDDGQKKTVEWFRPGIEFVLTSLKNPKAKVYIHCAAGINRGPSMAYAVLRAMGLSAAETKLRIETRRPNTQAGLDYILDAEDVLKQLEYTK